MNRGGHKIVNTDGQKIVNTDGPNTKFPFISSSVSLPPVFTTRQAKIIQSLNAKEFPMNEMKTGDKRPTPSLAALRESLCLLSVYSVFHIYRRTCNL